MNILIITPFFPHVSVHHAGGKFVYEMIKGLSRRHDIHLFSRIEPHEIRFVEEMQTFCKSIELYRFKTPTATNPLKTLLITASYLYLAVRANQFIRRGQFDIVQVEHIETGLLIRRVKNTTMILDAHDVISKPAERRYISSPGRIKRSIGWLKWQIIKRIEMYITRNFDIIFTRSRMDKDILTKLDSNLNINVIPHPVEICKPSSVVREENIILFAGAMHRDVNQDAVVYFYKKVFPFVKHEIPDIKFYVVGNNPPEAILKLVNNHRDIVVTGYVDSLTPYYQKATVFVSPILVGGGIIAKNIEAMVNGLPVVTTSIGNEGIEAVPERDALIADTPEDFSKKVIILLKDKGMRTRIGETGRRFVTKRFDLKQIIDKVDLLWMSKVA